MEQLCTTFQRAVGSTLLLSSLCLIELQPARSVSAAEPAEPAAHRAGALVIAGGGNLPTQVIDRFMQLGGGTEARLIIITTASSLADTPEAEARVAYWKERNPKSFRILHTRSRTTANDPEFTRPLEEATAVWFVGGNQNWLAETYLGTRTEDCLHGVLQRGGVIGGTSAGAAIMTRAMIAGGRTEPILSTGLGFLPNAIVDQHFLRRNRAERLRLAMDQRPGLVGIGIDEGTALVVRPEQAEIIGESDVVVCLAPSHNRPEVRRQFRPGESLDLGKWSLAATGRARFGAYGKLDRPPTPNVRNGAVVIAGSNTPRVAVERFLDVAGGKDAQVVLVSADAEPSGPAQRRLQECFQEAGAVNVRICQASSREDLADPSLYRALADARGVWFIGAQERRLLELVAQAQLQRIVGEVLERGGAVGGSSAGASIHGDGMMCETPSESVDPLADAYECGMGVLSGVVIGQQPEGAGTLDAMATALRERFPKCVGLGLKDSAAVVVRGHTMEVVGPDPVAVFDRVTETDATNGGCEVVAAGQKYDLRERRLMHTAAEGDATTR